MRTLIRSGMIDKQWLNTEAIMLTTLFVGPPYGVDGEAGDSFDSIGGAWRYARDNLQPGQGLHVMNEAGELLVWYHCNPDRNVIQVAI